MKRNLVDHPPVTIARLTGLSANRLGGNGVADIVVNGRLAGITASKNLK